MIYLKDELLTYHIIISKGKGYLTLEAKELLILLCQNIYKKFIHRYNNKDDKYDMYVGGLMKVLTQWRSFNHKKYDKSIPFFTEVFKRGVAEEYNLIVLWKRQSYMDIKLIRIDFDIYK